MIDADDLMRALGASGFDFYTGVPCSYFTALIDYVVGEPGIRYVGATSEGEAMGIAAGAWLGGRMPVVLMQNSGLGNAVSPITSLNHPFRIPALLLITWRGRPGETDEPQHAVMGRITHELLDLMGVRHAPLPDRPELLAEALATARAHMRDTGLPFAFVVPKGCVGSATGTSENGASAPVVKAPQRATAIVDLCRGAPIARHEALAAIRAALPPEAGLIATTGKTGRELFTLGDRGRNLYLVGSMGCASAVGLGAALASERPLVVLDGDGAALMKLGNWATIGAERPERLVHVLLDNGVHDSTGGQPTASGSVDFAAMALAAGYRGATRCDDATGLAEALSAALATPGPHLVHARIRPGSIAALGRPTLAPQDVATRFRAHLADGPIAADVARPFAA